MMMSPSSDSGRREMYENTTSLRYLALFEFESSPGIEFEKQT